MNTGRNSGFFNQPNIVLNKTQKNILDIFASKGLKASDFIGLEWFNGYYHEKAFIYLVNKKNDSFQEAFKELDKLDEDQARGILQGMNSKELSELTWNQIEAFLRYGISKSDLINLDKYSIKAFLMLRDIGISSEDLRDKIWLNNDFHVHALFYLCKFNKIIFTDACNYLADLCPEEANAITYGLQKDQVKGLDKHLINVLIEGKKYQDLGKRENIEGLNTHQIDLLKRLSRFGLTAAKFKSEMQHNSYEYCNSIERLVLQQGILVDDVLKLVQGLNELEVYGLSFGLSKDEVTGLNEFQMSALIHHKTVKNGLNAQLLRNKHWFNSKEHVDALQYMLFLGEYTGPGAMAELDELTGKEAQQVSEGRKRDDIFKLTQYQLKAVNTHELKKKGLRGCNIFSCMNLG